MKKILFYINSIRGGGAERVIVNLSKDFAQAGFQSVLVTSFKGDWEYDVYTSVKRISLENEQKKQSRLARNIGRIAKLRKVIKENKPDVVVSFMAEPNYRNLIATVGLPVKTVISVRNDPDREYSGKAGRLLGQYLLPTADGCVFQTEDAKKWFPQKLQSKSKIIYNAVKEDFYTINRSVVKGEIITCGRLQEQKNHAMLIDAFAQAVNKYPFARLKIYGDGVLKEKLQAQIDSLGLQDKVKLMGPTQNVEKALQTADIFVLSSDYEGMPNALMEAMAAGVPCISTDCPCGGPKELFGAELAFNLVQTDNANQLAGKIQAILAMTEEEKNHLSQQTKAVADKFRPDKIKKEWIEYVGSVADKGQI